MIASRTRRVAASLAVTAATLAACERAHTREDADTTTIRATTSSNATSPGDTAPRVSVPPPTLGDTTDPAATLRAYLARARMHRATRDTLVWEPGADGASGFRAFADSTISTFVIGSAGRIDAAAGSRYVTLPFTIDVVTGGTPATMHGTATLRRAVVDGASDAERRWRIMRIEWSAAQ